MAYLLSKLRKSENLNKETVTKQFLKDIQYRKQRANTKALMLTRALETFEYVRVDSWYLLMVSRM